VSRTTSSAKNVITAIRILASAFASVNVLMGSPSGPYLGLRLPSGQGGRSMLPVSQQPLQRPKCLRLWSGHRRLGKSSCVHLQRPTVAPQLTHAVSIQASSVLTMLDRHQRSLINSAQTSAHPGTIITTDNPSQPNAPKSTGIGPMCHLAHAFLSLMTNLSSRPASPPFCE
jgi:hypothetical protein